MMTERFFAPQGPDAIEVGTIIDDDGQRFVVMRFNDGAGDAVIVSMLIPMFQAFAAHIGKMAEGSSTRDWWKNHPRD